MNRYYCIGSDIFFEFLEKRDFADLIRFNFNPHVFPIADEASDGVIVQAEATNGKDVFHNINLTLPLLIVSNFKKPIILVGFLSEKYYATKFKIIFNSENQKSEVQFSQLHKSNSYVPLIKDDVIHDKFNKNELWKPYFKEVHFIHKKHHDLISKKPKYKALDFNKYKKIIKNLQSWIN